MRQKEPVAGGMFAKGSTARVPLVGVSIYFVGSACAAKVAVRQKFVNTEAVPIEAVYTFPLEERSAVCELVIETGGRRLVGRIEEREQAFEQYDDAIATGHGAFLADQDRPNVFTVSVGNLLPGQEATVCLAYVTELEQRGRELRIMLPTTISPRYVPPEMKRDADPAELERINPPVVLGPVPYGLSLTVDYVAPGGIVAVACPSHPVQVELAGNRVQARLLGRNVQLDRDFVLNVTLAEAFMPSALVAADGPEHCAVMLNLYRDPDRLGREPRDFVFLLDRSGSMGGESIAQALDALRLALRSMEAGDTFNVVGFGSRFELMFPHSLPYTQDTLDRATRILAGWDADLGGTELLAALRAVLGGNGTLPRQVMVLTDGQVGNEAQCIAAVAAQAHAVRVLTFGVGYGASEHLVRGLARAGGGQAEFIHPAERIEPVVMRQFARAAAPLLRDVRVDWSALLPGDWDGQSLDLVTPARPQALFAGDRFTIYGRLRTADARRRATVTVLADGPQGTLRYPVTVDLGEREQDSAVPRLMARSAIRELEEARDTEPSAATAKVLELALRYGLLSSQTSLVAVEERSGSADPGRPELRRVPVALTHGWGVMGREPDRADVLAVPRAMAADSALSACERQDAYLDLPVFCRRAAPPHDRPTGTVREDPFMLLVQAQRADGSFRLAPDLLQACTLDPLVLLAAIEELGAGPRAEAAAHTALALALLEQRFAERRDEWRLLADKAARWLAFCGVALPAGAASWGTWAANLADLAEFERRAAEPELDVDALLAELGRHGNG